MQESNNNQVSHGGEQPNAYGAKLLTIRSGNPGHYLVSIHQMAPPEHTSDKQFYSFIDHKRMKG